MSKPHGHTILVHFFALLLGLANHILNRYYLFNFNILHKLTKPIFPHDKQFN